MLNGFDPLAPRFLADLERIQERSQRAERQISSGYRVETASDDPAAVVEILRLRSRLSTNTQILANLNRVKSQVDSSEAAMRQAVSIVERARVLAAQTSSSTVDSNRTTMAIEARQLHDQLLSLVNTTSEGRFVFSGDGTNGPSYAADWSSPGGVNFTGASRTNTLLVLDENQTSFSVSRTASELFDPRNPDTTPTAGNAFKALHDLALALENDSESDVQAALPGIVASLDHLNRQLAFFGNSQNRVAAAIGSATRSSISLQGDLSRLQDTDLPAAILELNISKLHHETALSAHSRAQKSSLFDYLG